MQTLNQFSTVGEYFKSLRILHLALVAGVAVISLVLLSFNNFSGNMELGSFALGGLFLAAGTVAVGWLVLRPKLLEQARAKPSLREKLTGYRSYAIMSFALVEGAALFNVLAYLFESSYFSLATAGLLLLFFAQLHPSTAKVAAELELPPAEAAKLEQKDKRFEEL